MSATFTWRGDPAQHEPFMVCDGCGANLCTIEEGDALAVIVSVAEQHVCAPVEVPDSAMVCPNCGEPAGVCECPMPEVDAQAESRAAIAHALADRASEGDCEALEQLEHAYAEWLGR